MAEAQKTVATAPSTIGGYGLFWKRDEHNWKAPRGSTFQMLGLQGESARTLRVCDFRAARGVYVLYNDYRATYVGRARGKNGFGERLREHDKDSAKNWNRFCWFTFDAIKPLTRHAKWSQCVQDTRKASSEQWIDAMEALMIQAFGLLGQNQMKIAEGKPWRQVTFEDAMPWGLLRRADTSLVKDTILRNAITEE